MIQRTVGGNRPRYQAGQVAYIVANGRFVREVTVVRVSGGFCTLRFADSGGGTRLREGRLFPTRADAGAHLPQPKRPPRRTLPCE